MADLQRQTVTLKRHTHLMPSVSMPILPTYACKSTPEGRWRLKYSKLVTYCILRSTWPSHMHWSSSRKHKVTFVADKRLAVKQASPLLTSLCFGLWYHHHSQYTRRSANAEEPCEHIVSWKHVKCCTNVRQIAFENLKRPATGVWPSRSFNVTAVAAIW